MHSKKLPVRFLPITWREEDQKSNVRNLDIGFKLLKVLFQWRLGKLAKETGKNYETQML